MRYMVFDLPAHPGSFDERRPALADAFAAHMPPHLQIVAQHKLTDEAALQALLRETVRAGGEGLMLHRGASLYRGERNDDLLKLKEQLDAEATVIGHIAGKGKYQGPARCAAGANTRGHDVPTRAAAARDADLRSSPPAIGSHVTYRYLGLHAGGPAALCELFCGVRTD